MIGKDDKMIYKLKQNRVWRTYLGGAHIDVFLGNKTSEITNFPEDWTASAVSAFNPGRKGITEGLGMTENGIPVTEILNGEMPILLKLLDSAERLVIQVHPTVPFAIKNFGVNHGKTECWYFLESDPDAYVYIGFKKGINREAWKRVFDEQDIDKMLSMLHRIPVKKGDCIFVEGGMPHAIGAGCFMIELQEPSDLMAIPERKTPSGRELSNIKLHGGLGFEKMFDMFIYKGYSKEEILNKCYCKSRVITDGTEEIIGKDKTDLFTMLKASNNAVIKPSRPNTVAIVTDGEGYMNGTEVKKGDRLLLVNETSVSVTGNGISVITCF